MSPPSSVSRASRGTAAEEFLADTGGLPWQRLTDEQLVALDPTILGVLFAESVRTGKLQDAHEDMRRFLACAHHCAHHPKLEGARAGMLCGIIKNGSLRRVSLMQASWHWAGQQMDMSNPRGAGLWLHAALKSLRREKSA